MPVFDIIFFSLTIISSLLGLSRGLVKEFLSLAKWVISLYLAFVSLDKVKLFLSNYLKETALIDLISGIIIFSFFYIILSILFNFISKLFSMKSLAIVDKTLGCFFGFLRMILIFSLIFIIYSDVFYNTEKPNWLNDSYSIKYIEKVSIYIKKKILDLNLKNDIIT